MDKEKEEPSNERTSEQLLMKAIAKGDDWEGDDDDESDGSMLGLKDRTYGDDISSDNKSDYEYASDNLMPGLQDRTYGDNSSSDYDSVTTEHISIMINGGNSNIVWLYQDDLVI